MEAQLLTVSSFCLEDSGEDVVEAPRAGVVVGDEGKRSKWREAKGTSNKDPTWGSWPYY